MKATSSQVFELRNAGSPVFVPGNTNRGKPEARSHVGSYYPQMREKASQVETETHIHGGESDLNTISTNIDSYLLLFFQGT